MDVTVSSIGDATSLQGGILLQTPLIAPDGNVYAVALVALVLGGFTAGNAATGITVNHPTAGGSLTGRQSSLPVVIGIPQTTETLELILDRADFTTVRRVVEALNASFGQTIALPIDGRSIRLTLPPDYHRRPIDSMSAVEAVSVEVDTRAKVVINERTGTVIIGNDVTIAPVSIAHGNLSISIETQFSVSQPQPFAPGGQTVVVPEQRLTAQEQKNNFVTLGRGATVDDFNSSLECLRSHTARHNCDSGSLETANALQAELEII